MNTSDLRKSIITLASLVEVEAPVISAYFDLEKPEASLEEDLKNWVRTAGRTFEGESRGAFETAVASVHDWLRKNTLKAGSAAVFARADEPPFFMSLTFKVPLETFFHVDSLPAIYPLIELKDRFSRFVVVLTNQDSARIIEMNLGDTSLEMLTERPEIRERQGREWTRQHYLSHTRERDKKFVKEKVAIIERLMSKRGHNALIVAGEPRYIARLTEALPRHLQEKVVDELRTGVSDERVHLVLEGAIASYLAVEDRESETAVRKLFRSYRTNGLATIGVAATIEALQIGQADQLIISSDLRHDDRENLVRLASQHQIPIETVRGSELLDQQGGAGALLRYRLTPVTAGSLDPS